MKNGVPRIDFSLTLNKFLLVKLFRQKKAPRKALEKSIAKNDFHSLRSISQSSLAPFYVHGKNVEQKFYQREKREGRRIEGRHGSSLSKKKKLIR